MENRDIARILRETAQLLEIDGAIVGRYRSYEKAAELIYSLTERVDELAKDPEKLTELPGIGDRMAEHIGEILKTGDYGLRQKLLKKFPPTLLDLLKLQSLGPKKAALLWSMFQAATVEDVEKLAREGKLRDVPGFGEKTEQNILKAVEIFKKSSGRYLLHNAEAAAQTLVAYIKTAGKAVESVVIAGSLRRSKETAGDLDLLVTLADGCTSPKAVESLAEHILKYPSIDRTLARGENKVSFTLGNDMQVDVRMLDKECFGAALIYFTGAKEHNVALRGRALKMGYTLNEYALATVKGERRVAGKTEEEIYAKLKLAFIPPELRENCGEIEAAAEYRLPKLVCREDIRGDLQMHTTASDGKNTIEEMAGAARAMGHQYIAITDHSKSLTITNGLDEKRLLQHLKNMRDANARGLGIRVLAGAEVDILKDGRMDYENELLAQIDVVVASVHSFMSVGRAEMTGRLLAAIENPYTQIIAHPTGRILLRRDPYDYDMEKVLDAAAKYQVAFECNAYPDRLDLNDTHLRMAKERGVKIVISTDSHRTQHLEWMRYGVQMARRGWLEKADVLNTLPVEQFLSALRPKPGAATPAIPATKEKPRSSAVTKGRS
ncbi:MAG TPA: DNA polymerase/3'-5' exonuclease PolX [Candidatus Dormibacteraeota bacterium]|nr:DNA polymerase/3'-5' exonuclease PolX [Candidatus Dormibacteraeota bacterium]